MAEAEVVEPVVEEKVEPVVEPEAEVDLTREPGGDSPEETYARRRTRELRQAKDELERERVEKARLEGEVRVLKEARATQKPEQKILSIAEVNALVEAGTNTREEGDRYIQEVIIPKQVDDRIKAREAEQNRLEPFKRARDGIEEFKVLFPSLMDKNSPEFKRAQREYLDLIALGYEPDIRLEFVAAGKALGPLASQRKRREIAEMNATPRTVPIDSGGSPSTTSGKIDLNKASEWQKADWDREGADQATRERQYRLFLQLEAQRKARLR